MTCFSSFFLVYHLQNPRNQSPFAVFHDAVQKWIRTKRIRMRVGAQFSPVAYEQGPTHRLARTLERSVLAGARTKNNSFGRHWRSIEAVLEKIEHCLWRAARQACESIACRVENKPDNASFKKTLGVRHGGSHLENNKGALNAQRNRYRCTARHRWNSQLAEWQILEVTLQQRVVLEIQANTESSTREHHGRSMAPKGQPTCFKGTP